MYYYLYKITNTINDKIYIGVHQTQDLDDGYLGSGLNLSRAIRKYGKENFTKVILEFFDNEKDMLSREKEVVNAEFVRSTDTYNIIEGGQGSFSYINSLPRQGHKPGQNKAASIKANEAFKKRMSEDPEFKRNFSKKISKTMKEKHRNGEFTHPNPATYHRWISNDTIQKTKYVNIETLESYFAQGWYFGKKYNNRPNTGKKYKERSENLS